MKDRNIDKIGKKVRQSIFILSSILIVFFILHHFDYLKIVSHYLGFEKLQLTNISFLNKIKSEALELFTLLCLIDGFVELLKSISTGFSFFIEFEAKLGSILTPLQGMLNKSMFLSLFSITFYEILAILLNFQQYCFIYSFYGLIISIILLNIYMCLYLPQLLFVENFIKNLLLKIRNISFILLLIFCIILPGYLLAMQAIDKIFLGSIKHNIGNNISFINKELHIKSIRHLQSKAKLMSDNMNGFNYENKSHIEKCRENITFHIIVIIMEIILLPFACILIIRESLKLKL